MPKQVDYILGETRTEKVTLSHEHVGFEWLRYPDARDRITYVNSRRVLIRANALLKGQG